MAVNSALQVNCFNIGPLSNFTLGKCIDQQWLPQSVISSHIENNSAPQKKNKSLDN